MADYTTGFHGHFSVSERIRGLSIHEMMQEAVVFLIITGSVSYLLRKTYLGFSSKDSSCEGCGLKETSQQPKK
jgi:hypothetical protein